MRLIDAEALIEEIESQIVVYIEDESTSARMTKFAADKMCCLINRMPTAYDVEKVVTEVDDFEIRCCDCQESCNTEGCLIERIKNVIRNGGKE